MASQPLKPGFTTGAAAAAAAHAATKLLLQQLTSQNKNKKNTVTDPNDLADRIDARSSVNEHGCCSATPDHENDTGIFTVNGHGCHSVTPGNGNNVSISTVKIRCLNDTWLTIPIHRVTLLSRCKAEAIVIKDAGDDPDVTHKAEIGARVTIIETHQETDPRTPSITLIGGEGVGRVTKPGLEVPPGEPAINPSPRTMIRETLERVLSQHASLPEGSALEVEIFVPRGQELAKKTLNARLGIVGGISILGTTGIVRPMSHDAYIATIRSGISVAGAMACDTVVFTTGRRSERFAMERFPDLPEEAFIQIGDFFQASLTQGQNSNIQTVVITVFFGKAVKMAMGFPHTHAAKSELTMKTLAQWALDITGSKTLRDRILEANTARHAFEYIHPDHPELIAHVGEKIVQSARKFAGDRLEIRSMIFDFDGNLIFDSNA